MGIDLCIGSLPQKQKSMEKAVSCLIRKKIYMKIKSVAKGKQPDSVLLVFTDGITWHERK